MLLASKPREWTRLPKANCIEVFCGGRGRTGLDEQDREMTGSSRERGEKVSRRERLDTGVSNP